MPVMYMRLWDAPEGVPTTWTWNGSIAFARDGWIVKRDPDCGWLLIHNDVSYYKAFSEAEHPGTVYKGEWFDSYMLPSTLRFVHMDLTVATESNPWEIWQLGRDFFFRGCVPYRTSVWYLDPCTGETHHSAAVKRETDYECSQGRMFCHICNTSISTNNFKNKHIRRRHPDAYTKSCADAKFMLYLERELDWLEDMECHEKLSDYEDACEAVCDFDVCLETIALTHGDVPLPQSPRARI